MCACACNFGLEMEKKDDKVIVYTRIHIRMSIDKDGRRKIKRREKKICRKKRSEERENWLEKKERVD